MAKPESRTKATKSGTKATKSGTKATKSKTKVTRSEAKAKRSDKARPSREAKARLKDWDGHETPEFSAEIAARMQQIAKDYFHRAIVMGTGFTLPTRSDFLRGCASRFEEEFKTTIRQSLDGASAEPHRAAVEAHFLRWMDGNPGFVKTYDDSFSLPEVDEENAKKLTELFGRTTIQRYEWYYTEENNQYAARSRCDFKIGAWKATATWSVDDKVVVSDCRDSELEITDFDSYDKTLSAIEEQVESGLPPKLLAAFLYLVAFDLLHDKFAARPEIEDFGFSFGEEDGA